MSAAEQYVLEIVLVLAAYLKLLFLIDSSGRHFSGLLVKTNICSDTVECAEMQSRIKQCFVFFL